MDKILSNRIPQTKLNVVETKRYEMGPKRTYFPVWETLGLSNLFLKNDDISNLPTLPTLPMNYTLRATSVPSEEYAGIAACLAEAFGPQHGEWTPERARKEIADEPMVKQTFVIEYTHPDTNEVEIVGTASAKIDEQKYSAETGYLHWVGVHPDHQGHGFGLLVSLAVLYHFRDVLHCTAAVLETQDTSLPAIKSYFKLGFHEVHLDDSHPGRWEVVHKNMASFSKQ